MSPVVEINRLIKFRWARINQIAYKSSRFYLRIKNQKVIREDMQQAIYENDESDKDLLEHFAKGNLLVL